MPDIFQSFVYINCWNILVTMCNTLITFAIIKKFLFKPVRKMLAAREEEAVSYTHLDVYKRQIFWCLTALLNVSRMHVS